MRARTWMTVAAAATVMAVTPGPAGAAPGPSARATQAGVRTTADETINAKDEPQKAADTYAKDCGQDSKDCTWHSQGDVTPGYGPVQIVGDALYNCSTDDNDSAETSTDIEVSRAETTSLSEELAVKVQGGLFNLASASVEFKAFAKEASTFETAFEVDHAVSIPAGWWGYTATQLLGGSATGDVYITEGIKLIKITNVDVNFPGFQTNQERQDGLSAVTYPGYKAPMNADQIASRCNRVNGGPRGTGTTTGHVLRKPVSGRFRITIDRRAATSTTPQVIGAPPPRLVRAKATLAASGHTVATGGDRAGDIRLTARRPLKPGRYVLRLRTPSTSVTHGRHGTAYSILQIPVRLR
jgi:hypothetical protein